MTAWESEQSYLAFKSAQTPYSQLPHYPFERVESNELYVKASSSNAPH